MQKRKFKRKKLKNAEKIEFKNEILPLKFSFYPESFSILHLFFEILNIIKLFNLSRFHSAAPPSARSAASFSVSSSAVAIAAASWS